MNSEINISAWHREREGGDAAAKIFNFQNLYKAYISCRRHKRNTYHAAEFEVNYESELLKLEEELQDHNYKLGRSICFVVKEPSLREIFAATFRDRVVHHAVHDVIEPVIDRTFIFDSYANRKGKGTLKALKRFDCFKRKISHNNTKKVYVLKPDIKHYFETVNHETLINIIRKRNQNV